MSYKVAVIFPSCNQVRAQAATNKWLKQGYDVYIYMEVEMNQVEGATCIFGNYPGYNAAVNVIAKLIMKNYVALVFAADDMDPCPNKTGLTIAEECFKDYGTRWCMQPSGDLFQKPNICGSPWMSSELCYRAHKGKFAYPGWYWQWFGDDELYITMNNLGIHHRRYDLTQYHHHWWRPNATVAITDYQKRNQETSYPKDQLIFNARKDAGFPGTELL